MIACRTLRTLALALLTGAVVQFGAVNARPVLVAAPTHVRLMPLQGGQNFRDLGGYRTADGRVVRWGLLFRSGSMHGLTAADYDYLEKLGIKTVCDLRSTAERQAEPVAWPATRAPRILVTDYENDKSAVLSTPAGGIPTGAQERVRIAADYPRMLDRFNEQYRRMFGELLAGRAPLAFNCTAGKDRTGIGAALLLTALGVPRETVIGDYLLTNKYLNLNKAAPQNPAAWRQWSKVPRDVLEAHALADRGYIEAVLATVDAHAGGVDGYLSDRLGLTEGDRKKLVAMYTSKKE